MKNEPMAYWNVLIVNKSKSGGVIFHPSGSCGYITNPVIHPYGRLSAHSCAGSRLFLFL